MSSKPIHLTPTRVFHDSKVSPSVSTILTGCNHTQSIIAYILVYHDKFCDLSDVSTVHVYVDGGFTFDFPEIRSFGAAGALWWLAPLVAILRFRASRPPSLDNLLLPTLSLLSFMLR